METIEDAKSNFPFNKSKIAALPTFLFSRMLDLEDDKKLAYSAKLYSQLDFHSSTFDANQRKRYRNFQIYLTWLFIVFVLVGGIYRHHVLPNFEAVYAELEISVSASLMTMDSIWLSGIFLLASALLITFILNHFIKKVDNYIIKPNKSRLFRIIVPGKIRRQIDAIHQLIMAPLASNGTPITQSINWLEANQLNVAEEINAMILEQKNILENDIEKRMGWYIALVFLLIIFLIYELVNVMYLPIFQLGATI
ncbi:hypothetical protein [Thalassotalea litorea]|uniref:hypothetical protein n=1 Tax=Thalassotalea litorea TaxID=2020715 RepID=UPI001BB24EE8|nr:hypothetical protein [Thalassotalea litorea]